MKFLPRIILTGSILCFVASEWAYCGIPFHPIKNISSEILNRQISTGNENSENVVTKPSKVYCGGVDWTDGELLGVHKNEEIRTAIVDGKIYFKIGENITENKFSVFAAQGTNFKYSNENANLLDKCVNNLDPSTYPVKYLGSVTKEGIYCDKQLIRDKTLLGSYFELPDRKGRRTDTYAIIDQKLGVLRIAIDREGDAHNFDKFSNALMETIIKGENGSYLSPEIKNFTIEQVKGCFYHELPRYPEGISECYSDLAVSTVSNARPTGLSFTFKGNDVSTINWVISSKLNKDVVSGITENINENESISITYPLLTDGDYTLSIQDGSCVSSDSSFIDFSINSLEHVSNISFNARIVDDGVELEWEISSEKNNSDFEIIRYGNQTRETEIIGTVLAGGTVIRKYTFVDNKPLLGINFYQLKSIGANTTENSRIISVKSNLITDILLAPNPALEHIDIKWNTFKSGNALVEVYTVMGIKISGQVVHCGEGVNRSRINVKNLDVGTYLVKISMEGQNAVSRFIKVN